MRTTKAALLRTKVLATYLDDLWNELRASSPSKTVEMDDVSEARETLNEVIEALELHARSAAYTLEWQSPDGRWNRMSSSRPTKDGIVALAKWFFRDWLEMPPMRLIELPPNKEVSDEPS